MRAVVLGGNGFIGRHLVRHLLAESDHISILDLNDAGQPSLSGDVEFTKGSFLDSECLERVLKGSDVCFHLASTTLPASANADPVYDLETNVVGSVKVLEACVRAGIRKVIFLSSGGTVYGIPQVVPIPESHPLNPIGAYGVAKVAVEKYLHLYWIRHKLDYRIARMSNPYGPGQSVTRAQGVIPIFLQKAARGEAIEIWGDGTIVRDYIYVDDAVRAIVKLSRSDSELKIFNVGRGEGVSLSDIIGRIESIYNLKLKVNYKSPRGFDVPVNILDIARIQSTFGWQPHIGIEEGLEKTYSFTSR